VPTQTGQHPPLTAYNALLGAVNEAGSIDHCHLVRHPVCPATCMRVTPMLLVIEAGYYHREWGLAASDPLSF